MADKNYELTFKLSDSTEKKVQFIVPQGEKGADGKSAYQYAQDGGYTGTEEEFAAKLAAENSGGGGSVSWNDVTDKPFGEKNFMLFSGVVELEIDPELGMAANLAPIPITLDDNAESMKKVIIEYEGISYNYALTIADFVAGGGVAYLGNLSIMGGEDTGEPFIMMLAGEGFQIIDLQATSAVTRNVSLSYSAIAPISEEYLPDEYLPKDEYLPLQPDWKQTDETALDYIKNKPNVDSYLFLTYSADANGVNRLYKDGVMMTELDFNNLICNEYQTNKKPIAIGTVNNFKLPIEVYYLNSSISYGRITIAVEGYNSAYNITYFKPVDLYTAEYTPTT